MTHLVIKFALTSIIFSSFAAHAGGGSVPINYDRLSFFEKPLAVGVGSMTLNANNLIDQSTFYTNDTDDYDYNTKTISDITLSAQLPNSWQMIASYVANYDYLRDSQYLDFMSIVIADEWGTLGYGNVTGAVFEKMRRRRGVGNAFLRNDNFLGTLDSEGGFYSVRYNSYELATAVDKEGRFDAAISFERPIGASNYFTSLRTRYGNQSEVNGLDVKTLGAALVGEYSYASFSIDGQVGYEVTEDSQTENIFDSSNNHLFASIEN